MRSRSTAVVALAMGALVLTACPDDVREPEPDETPAEAIEHVRQAASSTLDAGTGRTTITLSADEEGTGADTTPDDAATADTDATDDGADDTDLATDAGTDANVGQARGELEVEGEEDFNQDQRRLTTTGTAGATTDTNSAGTSGSVDDVELIVEGNDVYVRLAATTGTDTATDTEPTPEATVGDDDDPGDGDDTVSDDDARDVRWGRFDLSERRDDQDQDDDTTRATDDELARFPFQDSRIVLELLQDVEGEAREGADARNGDAATGDTSYTVTVDVEGSSGSVGDDASWWLETLADGRDSVEISVWIGNGADEDQDTIQRVEYAYGDDTQTTTTTDDGTGTDDEATPSPDEEATPSPDDAGTTDDDATTDDAGTTDEDATTTDDDAGTADDDPETLDTTTETTSDGDVLYVTIEYRELGAEVEIELPEDDEVEDIDRSQLRQELPQLPTGATADLDTEAGADAGTAGADTGTTTDTDTDVTSDEGDDTGTTTDEDGTDDS